MGWIIAGAVVAVILILLMTSVTARFSYTDEELRLSVRWFFVRIIEIPARTKKQKKRDKSAGKDIKSAAENAAEAAGDCEAEKPAEKPQKDGGSEKAVPAGAGKREKKAAVPKPKQKKTGKLTLSDILALIKYIRDSLWTPLRRLMKAVRVRNFRLDIRVGGDDAAEAAINFGKTNMAAGAAFAFLDGCFTLIDPKFNITCDFTGEDTRTECSCTARVTVIAALAFLVWAVVRLAKNYMSRKDAAAAIDKLRNH